MGDTPILVDEGPPHGTNHVGREVWRNTADQHLVGLLELRRVGRNSRAATWDRLELALTINGGHHTIRCWASRRTGIRWEIIPDTSTPGNWLLNVYNSGGIGQDRTADDTPQIFGEDSIGGQRLYRRHPPGSAITVEGDGRISGRASSAGALTAYRTAEHCRGTCG